MFEPVNNFTPNSNRSNFQSSSGRVNSFTSARLISDAKTEPPEGNNRSGVGMPTPDRDQQIKKDPTGPHKVAIRFSIHEETGKTIVKIVDKDSDKIIREIPSKENLERSARLRMYVGQMFDTVA